MNCKNKITPANRGFLFDLTLTFILDFSSRRVLSSVNKLIRIFITFILITNVGGLSHADPDCSIPDEDDKCIGQNNTLAISGNTYTLYNNSCCYKQCISSATFNGTNCYCANNSYTSTDGNSCSPCDTANGFSSTFGSNNSISDCKKPCLTTITVTNGTSSRLTSNISQGSSCKYSVTCNPGYHDSVAETTAASYVCSANTYTVSYDCNGGSGATASSTHTYGVAQNLNANACSAPNGKSFTGWATASNATIQQYADKQSVTNLTTANGETFQLFAVWSTCSNTGAANAATWASGSSCTITKCNAGYQLTGTGTSTACIECTTNGYHCTDGINKSPCGKGYYCDNGKTKTPCPAGKTTTGTTAESSNACSYVTGAGGTKFCDKDDNCFHLPSQS